MFIRTVTIVLFTLVAVFGGAMMAGRMYENLRWWSTRSLVQKETSLYSGTFFSTVLSLLKEQAMYYRYAKKASQLPDVASVLSFFANDTAIQYPDHINALSAFNVYPGYFFLFTIDCFQSCLWALRTGLLVEDRRLLTFMLIVVGT